jgi:hypothetical protein
MHRAQYTYVRVDQMRQLSKSSMKFLFTTQGNVHRMYMELKLLSTVHTLIFIYLLIFMVLNLFKQSLCIFCNLTLNCV